MDTNVLLVILLVLTGLCALLLILQYIFKPKSSLSISDVIKTISEQNSSTLREIARENELLMRLFREANINIAERISQYNSEISKNVESTNKVQREVISGIEARINDLYKNTEARLERINQNVGSSLTKIQEGNEKKLNEMRQTVDEKLNDSLEKRLGQSFSIINERLESVYKGLGEMQRLAVDVGDLRNVLKNVKTRGTWGEVQLGNLLEQMLSPSQFASQVRLGKDDNSRVDFAVVMPGRDDSAVYLPIDSKYPTESYARLCAAAEAGDKAAADLAGRELEKTIKTEAKRIKERYIKVPATTDFAIMYLPIEGLFAEVVRRPGLTEELQRAYRIMVCGPTTLTALLNSLQMGFRTVAIEKRSSEIWALLSSFRAEFGKFTELLSKTQKKLAEAGSTIEEATKKTVRINKNLQAVNSLEPGGTETYKLMDLDDDEPQTLESEEDS